MTDQRELKPGEIDPDEEQTPPAPELVRVHHTGLDRSMVVRRDRLAQMDPAWEVQEPEELKGAALDQALEDAGLSKSGSADEKRARLAEHEAASLPAASDPNRDTAVITENNEE